MNPIENLRVSLVQGATIWHDPQANREYYQHLIAPLHGSTDLVVLPETFTSGFSNAAGDEAETMDGATVTWLREQAEQLNAAITGSVQIREGDRIFNRLLFATPDGGLHQYDKRHLFRYAREHEKFAPGRERLTVEWRGWRVCPMVCYDLRFPVFTRNRYNVEREEGLDYDLALFVANWPTARDHAWNVLLRARAIENLCYVVGLNRVGTDGNGIDYSGQSAIIDFTGVAVSECRNMEVVATSTLLASELAGHRQRFPAMLDADAFELR